MKKQKKILVSILVFLTILLSCCQVFATDFMSYSGEMEFSENFKQWMELEDKENTIMPRMYEVSKKKMILTNPLRLARLLGSSADLKYSLKDIIPDNMVIKNQKQTNSCWTFSTLAALESNLALSDKINQRPTIVYDFSERHMEYATSQSFLENAVNTNGFNRLVGSGGNSYISIPYLTNGSGAIAEKDMEFENNEDSIYISKIENKDIISQVNDIITFPSYSSTDDKTQIMQQMKDHIKNYGAIDAGIHGAQLKSAVYNYETGAIYCDDSSSYPINHAVAIIGWDDNYSVDNFNANKKPTNNGAWIIKNSWGTGEQYTLAEMKEYIFENFPNECANYGWTDATLIPDEEAIYNFENWGYEIENNVATLKVGDEGFMYVSYEDVNIYIQLTGIEKAKSELEFENVYQYDQFGGVIPYTFSRPKIYLGTVFNKKTDLNEYLTQVSIMAPETYTCKVYVNPNGTSKAMNDLQLVQLKAGETETFDAGYHTIEFAEPIKITGEEYVVVLEIQGTETNSVSVMMEFNPKEYAQKQSSFATVANQLSYLNNVKVESGKCFVALDTTIDADNWCDTSTMYTVNSGGWPDYDTTIKAFTTSKVLETIEVTTPPTKTTYVEGQDFDKTGMVVKANYANGTTPEITDYTISNAEDLQIGQTSVTISYNGKTTTQAITVEENTIESIAITTPATKTEYWAGDDFDATGMVVEATYKDETKKEITDYTITDGKALKNGQTVVTVSYEDKTTTQAITVKENVVEKIEIKQAPNKTNYVVGQNFDATGMIVEATYANGTVKEVTDYSIQDGTDLKAEQTSVIIFYEGKTVTQAITVEVKSVTSISVKTNPIKLQYYQNKEELDLTGGVIEISYNDQTKEEMQMTSEQITVSGFDNKELGTKTITLTYEGKTAQFDIEIIEEPKPVNSNFDEMSGNVKTIKYYAFTDADKKEYSVINIEINNIIKATENDKIEYYYYLSSNSKAENIVDWTKIDNLQQKEKGIAFEINTLDVSNYEEVMNAEKLYLYVKEVATRNNKQQELITSSMELSAENVTLEGYLDGEKIIENDSDEIIDSEPAEDSDDTLASQIIPNAGKGTFIVLLMIAIIVIGRIAYLRYKDIQIK